MKRLIAALVVLMLFASTHARADCSACGGPPSPQGDMYCMNGNIPFFCFYVYGVCRSVAMTTCVGGEMESVDPGLGDPLASALNDPAWINLPELGEWMITNNIQRVSDVPKPVLKQWRVSSLKWQRDPRNQRVRETWGDQQKLCLAIANGLEPTTTQLEKMGFDPRAFWGVRNPRSAKH